MSVLGDVDASLGLGPVDHIAFVTDDLAATRARFQSVFGPFEPGLVRVDDAIHRGAPCPVELHYAMARRDGPNVELVQTAGNLSPHAAWFARHGESLQHVGFRVKDLEAPRARLRDAGFGEIFGGTARRARFAYFESPSVPFMIELICIFDPAPFSS